MEIKNILPQIFDALDDADVIRVHDYKFYADARFDYVPEHWINQPAAALNSPEAIAVRPILSPIDILDILQSTKCVCGSAKDPGRSHCGYCYHRLPPHVQKSLYRRFKNGYEQAFLFSCLELIGDDRTNREKMISAVPKPKAA